MTALHPAERAEGTPSAAQGGPQDAGRGRAGRPPEFMDERTSRRDRDSLSSALLCASDCWRWLSADDVCRHALAAYYRACRDCQPPPGVTFMVPDPDGIDAPASYASPASFAETLIELLALHIAAAAETAGVGAYASCVERLERWNRDTPDGDLFAASQ